LGHAIVRVGTVTNPLGYSGTPLAQKLGFKDGQRVLFLDLPGSLDPLRTSRTFASVESGAWDDFSPAGYDVIHAFTTSRADLEHHGKGLMDAIARDGTVWISWPKKSSKVPTDITEDVIREVLLPIGLVDVKVCAVDETWSGLKMVIRKELR
jgi:hypothetical protein